MQSWFAILIQERLVVGIHHFLPNDASGKVDIIIVLREFCQYIHIVRQCAVGFFGSSRIILVELSHQHTISSLGIFVGTVSLEVFLHLASAIEFVSSSTPEDVDAAEIQFTRFGAGGVYEIDDLSFRSGCDFTSLAGLSPAKGEIPIVKARGTAPMPMLRDFYQFLVDTERAYWTGMQRYLQKDLGLEAPVSATQLGYSPPHVQADLDFVDNHSYWLHPSIGKDWKIGNRAMVNARGGCIIGLAGARVAGKPYTVSEYNHPYPNFYGAEGQPMLRAYGALQGWDGVFEYSYNNRQNAEPVNNEYFFSLAARSDVLAHFPACAAIYLRGDVKESATTFVANTSGLQHQRYHQQ